MRIISITKGNFIHILGMTNRHIGIGYIFGLLYHSGLNIDLPTDMMESVRNSSTTDISLGNMKLRTDLELFVLVLNLASTSILKQGEEHESYSRLIELNFAASLLKSYNFNRL